MLFTVQNMADASHIQATKRLLLQGIVPGCNIVIIEPRLQRVALKPT